MHQVCLASSEDRFTLTSEYSAPLDKHIDWCMDFGVTTSTMKLQLQIPSDSSLNKHLNRLETFLYPNNLVPQIWLKFLIPDPDNSNSFNMDDFNAFRNTQEGAVITWLNSLTSGLEQIYGSNSIPAFRFRMFNELNVFKQCTAEVYYEVLDWFYPLLQSHGPPGATLVISLAGSESPAGPFLTEFLSYHRVQKPLGSPLPFDGMDIHGYNTDYQHWSHIYQDTRSLYLEIFPENQIGENYFKNLQFWALESIGINHGMSSYVFKSCACEYNSDWDTTRHNIKTITHILNIPNMQFTCLQQERGEWDKRIPDGFFQMGGIYDHGCHIFDKGTKTPIYGERSIREFTRYINGYHPDTPYNKVFSTTDIRLYRFRHEDSKSRIIGWRDHANRPSQQTLPVPFDNYDSVYVVDLISLRHELVDVQTSGMGAFITIDLGDNPVLITPSLNTTPFDYRKIAPIVQSGVDNDDLIENADTVATLHLSNPGLSDVYVEIKAMRTDGSTVGSPFETMVPARGSKHINLKSIFEPFNGSVEVMSSELVTSYLEQNLIQGSLIHGSMYPLQLVNSETEGLSPSRFLTTDWETTNDQINRVVLVNTTEAQETVSITEFDEIGDELKSTSTTLNPGDQFSGRIGDDNSLVRYGMLELVTGPGVIGQISQYNTVTNAWIDFPLQDDTSMVDEIKMKTNTIENADIFSRVIVSNPWPETITGTITEKNSEGIISASFNVSLSGHETLEVILNSDTVSSLEVKMDNDVRVFGRREDTVIHTDTSVESTSVKSVKTDLLRPGVLVFPYFVRDSNEQTRSETTILITNDNTYDVQTYLILYSDRGEKVGAADLSINSTSTQKIYVSDLLSSASQYADGNIRIEISQVGGVSAKAVFEIRSQNYTNTLEMTASFEELN